MLTAEREFGACQKLWLRCRRGAESEQAGFPCGLQACFGRRRCRQLPAPSGSYTVHAATPHLHSEHVPLRVTEQGSSSEPWGPQAPTRTWSLFWLCPGCQSLPPARRPSAWPASPF